MKAVQVLTCVHVLLALLVPVAIRAGEPETIVETRHVRGNVHLLKKTRVIEYRGKPVTWYGNICASIGPDGILLVDNGIAAAAEQIKTALRSISDGDIAYLINTHWHEDHTGANSLLRQGAPILAHRVTREELMTEKRYSETYVFRAYPADALPGITFSDSLSLHFNGEEIVLIHIPDGHTKGDIAVFFSGSRVLYMGDTYNGHFFPSVCGDVRAYAASYGRLIRMLPNDLIVLAGHRAPATYDDLVSFHEMLVQTADIVWARVVSGKSVHEARAAGLPRQWDSWSSADSINALETGEWIETLYRSLSEHAARPANR